MNAKCISPPHLISVPGTIAAQFAHLPAHATVCIAAHERSRRAWAADYPVSISWTERFGRSRQMYAVIMVRRDGMAAGPGAKRRRFLKAAIIDAEEACSFVFPMSTEPSPDLAVGVPPEDHVQGDGDDTKSKNE